VPDTSNESQENKPMIRFVILFATALPVLILCSCSNESKNAAVITVDFEWQRKDKGSHDNPELRLTGVPEGTKRFLVSLVDTNLNGFDHGSGYVDNDGSGIIARGAVKGTYNGPDPPFPSVKHTYEISVKALGEKGNVIGIGKKSKKFVFSDTQ
jgi:phosphatidylethanolamine-binding protein (PEBP) family uncharacterized protein